VRRDWNGNLPEIVVDGESMIEEKWGNWFLEEEEYDDDEHCKLFVIRSADTETRIEEKRIWELGYSYVCMWEREMGQLSPSDI
jgi:hypothetical protein